VIRDSDACDDGVEAGINGLFVFGLRGEWQFAEGGAGEGSVLVTDLHGAIHEMVQTDAGAAKCCAGAAGLDAIDIARGAKRERLRQDPLLAPGQDFIQSRRGCGPRPVGGASLARLHGEPGIPHGHELWREALRRFDPGNARQPHLFDQPVLQRLIGALDTALGLGRQGINQFDIEALDDAAKLGLAIAAGGILGVDPEDIPCRSLYSASGRPCARTWALSASR